LSEVVRAKEDSNEVQLEVLESDKQVLFGIGDTVLSSRLIEGDYPDFEKIIPKNPVVTVLVDKEEFLRAIKLASVFARDAANVVRLKILKDKIKVSSQSSQSGSQEADVDAKIDGETLDVAFNYKFVEDFIHAVSGEEIKMEFTDAQKAVLFSDTSDQNFLHLIMPVRIQ
jgi:DNA polymerase-3 subunit beta